jgi:delta 1-pyrroline-5-carboxylate dehydrogenase
MRVIGKSMVALAVAFVVVGLVGGQQFGGRGGGFGGKGGGTQDAYTLLRNDQVKKELGVTEEQVDKIPAAVMKALGSVLDDKQMKRLRQIELQQRGTQAFLDTHVQKELKITPEQSGNIKTILDDSRKEQAEAFKEAQGGGGFGAIQEKLAELRKETNEKVQAVLTSDQRRAYKQLLGEEFKLEFKGFGGKGKKKQDI